MNRLTYVLLSLQMEIKGDSRGMKVSHPVCNTAYRHSIR